MHNNYCFRNASSKLPEQEDREGSWRESGRGRQEIREMRERRGWSARCNLKSSFVPVKLINRARRLLPSRTSPHLLLFSPFVTGLRVGAIRDNLPVGVISWKVHFSTVPIFRDVTPRAITASAIPLISWNSKLKWFSRPSSRLPALLCNPNYTSATSCIKEDIYISINR